jgi:PAS domain S-box-containing protein
MPPLEAFAIPAAVFDGTGVLLSCNSAFETLTGYAALEGMRLEVLHIQHPDGTLEDLFEVAQTLDLPATGHASLTRADTVVLEVAWTLGLWPAPGEGPDFLVLTATDVTDEKCLACKIKHSRDKYREAFDEQTELVCRFDPDTTIRFVNDAYARAFGRSPRQLIGSRLVDLLSPQDGEDFIAATAKKALNWPLASSLTNGGDGARSMIRRASWSPFNRSGVTSPASSNAKPRKPASAASSKPVR